MTARSFRVTIRDFNGIEHTAEVTADTLYEAVALGLAAIRKSSWNEGIAENVAVRVLVRDTPVEHTVELKAFTRWLETQGRTPKDITTRSRVREILGIATSR